MFRWKRSSGDKAAASAATRSQASTGSRPSANQRPATGSATVGARADVNIIHPVAEAHLCQLAALENYAEHGVFVKFGMEEAVQLEARALDLAVQQSTQDAELSRRGLPVRHGISAAAPDADMPNLPFTTQEAVQLLEALRSDADANVMVLPPPAARRNPGFPTRGSTARPSAAHTLQQQGGRAGGQSKMKSFSAFKRKFLPFNERGGAAAADRPSMEQTPAEHMQPAPSARPRTTGQGPGSDEHFANEAARRGYEMANGFVIPGEDLEQRHGLAAHQPAPRTDFAASAREEHDLVSAMQASEGHHQPVPGQYEEDEDALLAVALEESRIQAEYDEILREAIFLRRDMEAEMQRCRMKQVRLAQQHRDHLKRGDRATRKDGAGVPPHLAREAAESEHHLKEVDVRATAISYATQELSNLEHFIRTTKPSQTHAQSLTEEIIRELLRQLSFLGLHFDYPEGPEASRPYVDPSLVDAFRRSIPNAPPRTPPSEKHQQEQGTPVTPLDLPPSAGASPSADPPVQEATISDAGMHAQNDVMPAGITSSETGTQHDEAPAVSMADASSQSSREPTPAREAEPVAAQTSEAAADRRSTDASAWPLPAAVASRIPRPQPKPAASPPESTGEGVAERGRQGGGRRSFSDTASPPSWPMPPSENFLRSSRDSRSKGPTAFGSRPSLGTSVAMTPRSEISPSSDARRLLGKASNRLQRLANEGLDGGSSVDLVALGREEAWQGEITSVKRTSQVVHLYNELRKLMPERMERAYPSDALDEDSSDSSSLEAGETAHEEGDVRVMGLLADLATELEAFKPHDMAEVAEFMESAEARLGSVTNQPAAALQNAPTFPKAWWYSLRNSGSAWRQLSDLTQQQQRWGRQQVIMPRHHTEEAPHTEQALDLVRTKVDAIAGRVAAREQRWVSVGVPWDKDAVKRARFAALHLAQAFMSGVLGEVVALEREATLQHDACLQHLADAVRVTFKAHQLAGGLHPEGLELFDQIKRLTRYYVRVRDPTWLRTTTQLVGGSGHSGEQTSR